jgi:three-Cys-motif partner protein
VKLALVESDTSRRHRLAAALADAGIAIDMLVEEPFESVVDSLLDRYANQAVLIFVDPFGLAISFDTLVRILQRSSRQQPIDVLYHFSLLTVARMGRAAIRQDGPSSNAQQLDAALGPVAWRDRFTYRGDDLGDATRAAIAVAHDFDELVKRQTSVPSLSIPVSPRPGQLPKYSLTLFSRDPVGQSRWDFADQAGKAYVDWLLHCESEDYEANMAALDEQGLIRLFPVDEPPTVERVSAAIDARSAWHFDHHLRDVFTSHDALRPRDEVELMYGDLLGKARATHVRQALKRLHDAGHLDDDASGAFQNRILRWKA